MVVKDVLEGPRTPHWACSGCGTSNNWVSPVVCRCGKACSQKVRTAALSAEKAYKAQPRIIQPKPLHGFCPGEARNLQSQLNEQKTQSQNSGMKRRFVCPNASILSIRVEAILAKRKKRSHSWCRPKRTWRNGCQIPLRSSRRNGGSRMQGVSETRESRYVRKRW